MNLPRGERISEHFTWGEVYCNCGCEFPEELEDNARATAGMLEKVREALGEVPISVNSWYRCPAYQQRVNPDVKNGYHPKAMAADIVVKRMGAPAVQSTCGRLQAEGVVGGLGRYAGFTHLDTGPTRTWWQ